MINVIKDQAYYEALAQEWIALRKRLSEAQNHRCAYCGCQMHDNDFRDRYRCTSDHVIPYSQGGSDDYENLVAACYRCNSTRGDMDAYEFFDLMQEFLKKKFDNTPKVKNPSPEKLEEKAKKNARFVFELMILFRFYPEYMDEFQKYVDYYASIARPKPVKTQESLAFRMHRKRANYSEKRLDTV